jgi:hypothetical protein
LVCIIFNASCASGPILAGLNGMIEDCCTYYHL